MLFQTDTGFLDVVVEPRFWKFQFGSQLCSVKSSDLTGLMRMRNCVRGEIDYRPADTLFPFTGFAYLDDLSRELKSRSILEFVDQAGKNFTRQPLAYTYLAFEEPDPWAEQETSWEGDLWPSEVLGFEYRPGTYLEYFRVWPLFHVPNRLREEVQP